MSEPTNDTLEALAARVDALTGRSDNLLDVEIETALFRPGACFTDCRANDAGTKVIYTDRAGNEVTCWAQDWTAVGGRKGTLSLLRAKAKHEQTRKDNP